MELACGSARWSSLEAWSGAGRRSECCPPGVVNAIGTPPSRRDRNARQPLDFKNTSLKTKGLNADLFHSGTEIRRAARGLFAASATSEASVLAGPSGYVNVEGCQVYAPNSSQRKKGLKGILYFIGCAYLGGAPDLSYSYLFELLTSQGFVVIAVPYNLTFQHEACAKNIHSRFKSCLDALVSDGLSRIGISGEDISSLPVHGLSHSNGALMHALIGSLYEDDSLPKANVFVSFNNKPAKDAIPFFDQLGPQAVQLAPAIESFPLTGIILSVAEQAIQTIEKADVEIPSFLNQSDLRQLAPLADQVPSVFSEIFSGYSEFTPPPEENKKLISSSYSIPKNLLIKFKVDTLDETNTLESLLKSRFSSTAGELSLIELEGTHATPLAQDVRWEIQREYTPLDAIGQSLKSSYLKDLKTFTQAVVDWLNQL